MNGQGEGLLKGNDDMLVKIKGCNFFELQPFILKLE